MHERHQKQIYSRSTVPEMKAAIAGPQQSSPSQSSREGTTAAKHATTHLADANSDFAPTPMNREKRVIYNVSCSKATVFSLEYLLHGDSFSRVGTYRSGSNKR